MATPPKPRPQSAYQLNYPPSDAPDGDLELHRQQDLRQRISSSTTSKSSFDWLWQKSGILGNWMNKQAGKMAMEAFWPTSLDKECDKCARILYTFTQRGLNGTMHSTLEDPDANKNKKIPTHIIQQAEGLAIFTVFRTGLGWSAASGSGIVIARDSPTTWGAPSGILVHTVGVGFLAGINVYDAVLVLRTQKAVTCFAKPKVSLGVELAVVAGPIGNGVTFESGVEASPVFSYTKSKGICGGLQLDGNIIIERTDENARFYGRKVKAEQILQGGAVAVPRAASGLITVIDAAEGKAFDPEDLPAQIDISPSEESTGVSTINESRAKAAAEYGIVEEVDDQENSNPSSTSEDNLQSRQKLSPIAFHQEPMAFHQEESTSMIKPDEIVESKDSESTVEPVQKLDDSRVELVKESKQSSGLGKEECDESVELSQEDPNVEPLKEPEPTVIQPPKPSLVPPPPPRRRVVPPPPTDISNDSPPSNKQIDSSVDSVSSPVVPPSTDSPSLLDHTDKPPEPFLLHERSASNGSTCSNAI